MVKTLSSAKVLMWMRDYLHNQAQAILEEPSKALAEAKARWHDAKIESNKLLKQADLVQSAIGEELMTQLAEQKIVEAQYAYRTNEQIQKDNLNYCTDNLCIDE